MLVITHSGLVEKGQHVRRLNRSRTFHVDGFAHNPNKTMGLLNHAFDETSPKMSVGSVLIDGGGAFPLSLPCSGFLRTIGGNTRGVLPQVH
jgi:hypothetical protein